MRLKLDENLGRSIADLLRGAGHDVATVFDEGLASAPDPRIYEVCQEEFRVLVTLDLDFANLLRFDPSLCPGIAVLRVPTLPGRRDLEEGSRTLIAGLERSDISGRLWIVERTRVRQYEPSGEEG
ncbi:MAG: DUF5615 family PIN-like protein [Actinomycetota bacterium]